MDVHKLLVQEGGRFFQRRVISHLVGGYLGEKSSPKCRVPLDMDSTGLARKDWDTSPIMALENVKVCFGGHGEGKRSVRERKTKKSPTTRTKQTPHCEKQQASDHRMRYCFGQMTALEFLLDLVALWFAVLGHGCLHHQTTKRYSLSEVS